MAKRDPREEITELMRSATPCDSPVTGHDQSVTVNGDGNIVGNGNTVIKTEKYSPKVVVKPVPGAEHITESQVRRLHDLKDKVIKLELLAKKNPVTHQQVWIKVNKACGVGRMRMIPLDKFKTAEKCLLQWIGRLNDTKSVKKKDPGTVRNSRLAYIHAKMKSLDIEDQVREYLVKNFAVDSMKDLNQLELEKVYRYVASKKPAKG